MDSGWTPPHLENVQKEAAFCCGCPPLLCAGTLVYLVVLAHQSPQLWTHLRLTQCGQTFYLDYCVAQVSTQDKTRQLIVHPQVVSVGVIHMLLLCSSQWGRLDSYMDTADR